LIQSVRQRRGRGNKRREPKELSELKPEIIKTNNNFELRISGTQLRKQKTHTIELDKRLLTLVTNFTDMELDDFLRGIANNMAQGVKKSRLQSESYDDEQTQPANQPKIKRQRQLKKKY